MAREKKTHTEGEGDHLQTLCTQQKKTKITPESNLFSSKVGGMNYPLEEHIILSLLTTAKAWVISWELSPNFCRELKLLLTNPTLSKQWGIKKPRANYNSN